MALISNRVSKMEESVTLKMAKLATELKNNGKDVISLSLGEPDFHTPDFVKNAAKKAIDDNYTYYSPVAGYLDLRKAICHKLKRDNNLSYAPNQIVVSTGAKHSLMNIILSIVDPGDEVVVPAPFWVSYFEMIKFADGIPVVVQSDISTDFKITPSQLEKSITNKTKAFLFSNPCNPSGSVYSHDELKALAKILAKHPQVLIISDEIYEYITFEGRHVSMGEFPEVFNQVITVNGLSKGYAMTGWRLGYIAAPLEIAKACEKIQGQFTSGASTITQMAAITALNENPNVVMYMKDKFLERKELMYNLLKELPGFKVNNPQGAFYLFPDISYYIGKKDGDTVIRDADDFCMWVLEKALVALTGGTSFGSPQCIRISYATSNDALIESVKRIKNILPLLK